MLASVSTVYLVFSGIFVLTAAVLLAWLPRTNDDARWACGTAVGVVIAGAVGTAAVGFDVGTVPIAGGETNLINLTTQLLAGTGFWVVAARLAGLSRRRMVGVAAVPFAQRVAFEVPLSGVGGQAGAAIASVVALLTYGLLAYLFLGPIWRSAQSQPVSRRLLYWKVRNHLLFLLGMLIISSVAAMSGVFGPFVTVVIALYINVLVGIGISGFLFVNADTIAATEGGDVPPPPADSGESPGAAEPAD